MDPNDPYRQQQQRPQSELERLAAEGQRRHAAMASARAREANADADDNIRVGIGGAFGTPFLRGCALAHYMAIAALVVFILVAVTKVLDETVVGPMIAVSGGLSFTLIFVRVFAPPKASLAQVQAEEAWLGSFPFAISGYFEALAERPRIFSNIDVAVEFASGSPAPNVLEGVVRLADPAADGFDIRQSRARWRSGQIDGSTGIMVNKRPIYRNHRIPKWMHDLVEKVLVPIHNEAPIASVTLTRR